MARYVCTLFANFASSGWSEVYPVVAASPSAAATVLDSLVTLRAALSVSDVSFVGARISDTDIKNDSWPTGVSTPFLGTFAVAPADLTYNPQIAVRLLSFGGGLVRGSRWLRGVPKSQLNAEGGYAPTSPWLTALAAYTAYLIANVSIATKIKGAVAPPFYTFTAITAVTSKGSEKRNIGRPFGLSRGRRLIA